MRVMMRVHARSPARTLPCTLRATAPPRMQTPEVPHAHDPLAPLPVEPSSPALSRGWPRRLPWWSTHLYGDAEALADAGADEVAVAEAEHLLGDGRDPEMVDIVQVVVGGEAERLAGRHVQLDWKVAERLVPVRLRVAHARGVPGAAAAAAATAPCDHGV